MLHNWNNVTKFVSDMKTKKIVLIIFIVLLVIMGASALFAKLYLFKTYEYERAWLRIGRDCTKEQLDSTLTATLGKEFGDKVKIVSDIIGVTPSRAHGKYLVWPDMTALEVARNLKYGRQTPVRLTFNNLRYLEDLGAEIAEELECDSASFLQACRIVLEPKGYTKESMPSAFLPDTYEFYWTDSPERIVKKLLAEHDRFWNEERTEKAAKLGLTPNEVATIASIVEEETNKRDERPAIARVYLNRLNKKMALQADPTIKYALGNWSLRRINNEHLQMDTPYNTYTRVGLPPGPIRIVERTSIDAVLDSPEHDYVYMCAKPDFSGYHNFAKTYDEHKVNAARYHRALDARGIKNF